MLVHSVYCRIRVAPMTTAEVEATPYDEICVAGLYIFIYFFCAHHQRNINQTCCFSDSP